MTAEREMYLIGNEDAEVRIECRRKGCMVKASWPPGSERMVWLNITLDYDVTPDQVWEIWYQHRLDHANLER